LIRLVLFDIDGTLIHTGGAGVKAFARTMAAEFGCLNGTEHMKFGGRTDTSLVRELFHRTGVEYTTANVQRFFDRYVFWLDHLLGQSAVGGPCPGILSFLDQLEHLPAPPRVGLLTGNTRLGAEIKLRHFKLWDRFEFGAFSDDDEDRNCIARIAVERGGQCCGEPIGGEQVLVIGDTPRDVECGRSVNARVLAVATGGATLRELQEHRPDWLVPNLTHIDARTVCSG
jgi:phosphoglycolate phosphatase-like HAD superfamily hydrolase